MADLAGPPPPSRVFYPISLDIKALKAALLWPKQSDFWQKYVVMGNNRKATLDIHAYALAGSKRSQNNSCSSCCQVLLFCPWQWADPFIHSFLFWTSEKRARQGRSRTLFQSWPLLKFFSGQKVCRTNFCQQTQELDSVVSINFWGKAFLIWFYFVFVVNLYFIAYLGAVFRNSPQQQY